MFVNLLYFQVFELCKLIILSWISFLLALSYHHSGFDLLMQCSVSLVHLVLNDLVQFFSNWTQRWSNSFICSNL